MNGKWVTFSALSLAFFFVTATTFTSLAVVLFTMSAELHWSQTEAGLSFSLLGLACGLSSTLPAAAIKRIGARWTVVAGALMLATGFAGASISHGIAGFFVAICLMGCAFSLIAPVPGMFLLPRWFGTRTPRMIGFYFMGGSAGGVLGPLMVNASVSWTGSWRLHWLAMASCALLLALVCAAAVRDRRESDVAAEAEREHEPEVRGWTTRSAVMTRTFLATAFAMLVVQTALTVSNSAVVMRMSNLGAGRETGALATGLVALAGTLAKGVCGTLAARVSPLALLLAGLVIDSAAFVMMGLAHGVALALLAAGLIGAGWGAAWLGANLYLLRCFGRDAAPALVGIATAITTGAVLGPLAGGAIADRTGSYAPIFLIVAGLFVFALLAMLLVRGERLQDATAGQPRSPADAVGATR